MGDVTAMYPVETTGTFVRPEPSLSLGSPELHIRRNLEKAAQRGVNTVDLGYAIDALVDGAYSGDGARDEKVWHEAGGHRPGGNQ